MTRKQQYDLAKYYMSLLEGDILYIKDAITLLKRNHLVDENDEFNYDPEYEGN